MIIIFTAGEMEDQRGDIFTQDQPEEPKMYLNLRLSLFLIFGPCWHAGSYFPDQGLNLRPQHWKLSLNHRTTRKSPPTFLKSLIEEGSPPWAVQAVI